MKYLGVLFIGIVLISMGCEEEIDISPIDQFIIDTEIIDEWITENNIQDTLVHPLSNIRYLITEEGNGISPRAFIKDTVMVNYEGRILTTGEVFDSGDSAVFELDRTITGWQIMLPEMKEGSEFTIYMQSLYAYGTQGTGPIPPNAVLVFDIRLIRVGG